MPFPFGAGVRDSLSNLAASLGTGCDKASHDAFAVFDLGRAQIEAMYSVSKRSGTENGQGSVSGKNGAAGSMPKNTAHRQSLRFRLQSPTDVRASLLRPSPGTRHHPIRPHRHREAATPLRRSRPAVLLRPRRTSSRRSRTHAFARIWRTNGSGIMVGCTGLN